MNGLQELKTSRDAHPVNLITGKQQRHGLIKRSQGLTQYRVHELFLYDEVKGELIRKIKTSNSTKQGDIAGSLNVNGYINVMVDRIRYGVHQIVFLYHHGFLPEMDIDHIDRNPRNNKIENLREVSVSCNLANAKVRSCNQSGVTGVHYEQSARKWKASIRFAGKVCYLGRYGSLIEAACARLAGEQCCGWYECSAESTAYIFMKNGMPT